MSYYQKRIDEGSVLEDYCVSDDQMLGNLCRNGSQSLSVDKGQLEQEKRMRREIANSNERRRMQSINAGFTSLKTLLPHPDGEKLSKAAILQQTADYISSLEKDKNRLLSQNLKLKRLLGELDDSDYGQVSPPPKRKKRDTESSDEGINMPSMDEPTPMDLKREMIEIRGQLDRERCLRMMLEDQIRGFHTEAQMCPEKLRQIANQVTHQMRHQALRQKFLEEERRKQEIQEVKVPVKEEIKPPPIPDLKSPLRESVTPIEATPKVCPAPTPPIPRNKAFLNSYMSRRNLDMIVEAIRHLEGEQALLDQPARETHREVPNNSSSDDCHSSTTLSDQEDCYSGRESPVQTTVHAVQTNVNGCVFLGDPSLLQCHMSRPGVIVQTTSS